MEQGLLYPFTEYWWLYLGFIGFVIGMLALDLGVFHKKAHTVGLQEAALWSLVWISLALLFNLALYAYTLDQFAHNRELARQIGLEFLTGYLIEKSLSIDNIFVFIVVFQFFNIPPKYQHRVLFFGILGALVFRALFITLGALLMQYQAVVIVFGIFLLFTGFRIIFQKIEEIDPSKNWLVHFLRKHIRVTDRLHEGHFFVIEGGRKTATPLMLSLVFMEFTDIIFAVDSVPAIFAITNEPLIVFTSNIFAMLGLRSLYFLVAGVLDKFYLIKYGLAAVLIFVGLKMVWLNSLFGGKFPILWSLAIIASMIGCSILASILIKPKS